MTDLARADLAMATIRIGEACIEQDNPAAACALGVIAYALLEHSELELIHLVSRHSSIPLRLRKRIQDILGTGQEFNN